MGRVGENNPTPNEANDGINNQNEPQTRSLHPHQQQEDAYPPSQETHVYVHHNQQPAAFPPPPEKPHAFPPPQPDHHQHQQSPAAFPPVQSMQFQGGPNGGVLHAGNNMGTPIMNMPGHHVPGSPLYNNPAFQQMPPMGPMPVNQNLMGMNMEPWRSSLFDCFDDPENAIITACFPCVTFGQIAEIVDQGQSSCATSGMLYTLISFCIAMPCLISCSYRTKLRDRFRLVEAPGPDWLIHFFCEWCALCQEYRELKLRGYDPNIGWLGNAAKMNTMNAGSIAMTPPMQPHMMGR